MRSNRSARLGDFGGAMSGLLAGRVALVTGGARGLGHAIVAAFAEAGANGSAVDLEAAIADAALPAGFVALKGDVTDEPSLAAAVAATLKRFGRLDIVVANAGGVPPWRETETLDLAEWDRVFSVNVRGVAATLKHAVPALKPRGGAIIAMASINAVKAHPRQMLYTATKHAVLGIVRAAALDLGRYSIRVNALGPGPVATEALLERMSRRAAQGGLSVEAALQSHAAETPLGRMATPEDVGRAAVFLASDLAAAITGRLIPVDAGLI
jgi:NAD(P)-dependent dehydrogenase (short-subunit alcohol dehydrogenase family)